MGGEVSYHERHLEVLRWAREHGCRWDKKRCLARASDDGRVWFLHHSRSARLNVELATWVTEN